MSTSERDDRAAERFPADPRVEQDSGARRGRRGTAAKVGILLGLVVLAALVFPWLAARGEGDDGDMIPTVPVKRGPLTVLVTEGGALRAMESLEIKSEMEGNNQILELVPEGTVISQKDVEQQKVLVRLDASGPEETEASREISFANAEASYKQATENLAIQKKQNDSNVQAARLNVKFGLMELERYVGAELAGQLTGGQFDFTLLRGLAQQEVEEILKDAELTREVLGEMYQEDAAAAGVPIGGVARQTLRDLSADVQLATGEMKRASDTLAGTRKLFAEKFVSLDELTADELAERRAEVQLDSAQEELRLFIRYTLAKEAESRSSDYEEALRELDRVEARARSELAQAEANLASRKATFELERDRLQKTKDMIAKSSIVATKPGVVVYASTQDPRARRNDPIQEGASVRQDETILVVPDLSTLAARINIHETDIAKVKPDMPARITVEAMPGSYIPAHVAKISPMASSENRWLNPDVMVYEADIALDEQPPGVTPGMSTTAEIVVAQLRDVLYIPIQAVSTYKGQRICWVKTRDGHQRRDIECGHFTDKFVEIKDGLTDGELVYLAPPEELEEELLDEGTEAERGEGFPAAPVAAPAGAELQQSGPAEQADDAQQAGQPDLEELRKKLEGMSQEERMQFIQNLPEEQRRQLMQLLGRSRQDRGEGGGRGRPRQPEAGDSE